MFSSGEYATLGGLALGLIAFFRLFLWKQIGDLTARVNRLEKQYDEERSLKHQARSDLAKTVMALDLVQRLASECSCKVLAPLEEIIGRLVADLQTVPYHDRTFDEGDLP